MFQKVTQLYSTSFSCHQDGLPLVRQDILQHFAVCRLADEIMDSFHDYDKKTFQSILDLAHKEQISTNPILNAFRHTVHDIKSTRNSIDSFMLSMFGSYQKCL